MAAQNATNLQRRLPAGHGSVLVTGPPHPPPLMEDYVATMRRRVTLKNTPGEVIPVKVSTLACGLPGNDWSYLRFLRFSVWGGDEGALRVTSIGKDLAGFADMGTPGASRCQLHFQPDSLYQQEWGSKTSSNLVFNVVCTAGDTVTVDFTVQARTPNQSCAPNSLVKDLFSAAPVAER